METIGALADLKALIPFEPLSTVERMTLYEINRGPEGNIVDVDEEDLTKHDYRTLNAGQMLNDKVINHFAELVQSRSPADDRRPYIFNTYFMPTLVGDPSGYCYEKVQKWTNRLRDSEQLYARRAILFPLNVNRVHWTLVVADVRQRTLTYYDSMGDSGESYLQLIQRYLTDDYKDKNGESLPWVWALVSKGCSTPQQKNGVDCGVFMLALLNILCRGFELDVEPDLQSLFSQKDIARIRVQIQLDLVRGAVFPTSAA